ncbi:hypothetical protein MWN34_12225 [Ancylobacter sp. 6x-1]|uniref:Uncharacterized protein n=1 Tax=Ancylobacter crimeensis TaxID=2579147 RepID=A0ABT0DCJ9_9HYPH|nr:hypothetical protein [Ancylobacter crimeensis]MCK0197680.1 hypothetical protein [Ancylobacter crimeensis]
MNAKIRLAALTLAACTAFVMPALAQEEAHVKPVTEYVKAKVVPWLSDPVVIKAVLASNKLHAKLMQSDIDQLDADWKAKDAKLIDSTTKNELAAFLTKKKEAAGGVMTEAFVMDDRGLNVGQTDMTSDMWQADEAKWQKSYGVGPHTIFVDKVEDDDGKKIAQASITITDHGKAIGAITVGIDVGKLK